MTATAVREKPIVFSGEMVRAIIAGRKTATRRVLNPQPKVESGTLAWGKGDAWTGWARGTENVGEPRPDWLERCPYGEPGAVLYVKEQWACVREVDHLPGRELSFDRTNVFYPTEHDGQCTVIGKSTGAYTKGRWRSGRFMPRWAARILLEVTDVRVERLQSITEEDAIAEGFEAILWGPWWQGYVDLNGDLLHQTWKGDEPPPHAIEPKRMADRPDLNNTALKQFRFTWDCLNARRKGGIYSWDRNPWVWRIAFKVLTTNGELP